MRFFFFGLLRDRDVLELVLGRAVDTWPFPAARLADHRLVRLRGESFPLLVPAPGAIVEGVVAEGLHDTDIARIVFFESVEYEPRTLSVDLAAGGRVDARAFVRTGHAAHDDEPWTFEDWRARYKDRDLRETALWMALHGHLDVVEADRLWDRAIAEGRPLEDFVLDVCGALPRAASGRP